MDNYDSNKENAMGFLDHLLLIGKRERKQPIHPPPSDVSTKKDSESQQGSISDGFKGQQQRSQSPVIRFATAPSDIESTLSFISPTIGAASNSNKSKEYEVGSQSSWRRFSLLRGKSLRKQLMLAFGLVAFISLAVIVFISILTAVRAGDTVVSVGERNIQQWAEQKIGANARMLADIGTKKMESLEGMTLQIQTMLQERFMGYPSDGYLTDAYVPFPNYLDPNKTNVYPLKAKNLLPLDWQIEANVFASSSAEAAKEHVRDRLEWYFPVNLTREDKMRGISTSDASFYFQGTCNSSVISDSNCTDMHNNIRTGGMVQPTSTLSPIYQKVSDIASPMLKAYYEYHDEIKSIGIHFVNDGAGASVFFPGHTVDRAQAYTSIGCDWMMEGLNPRTQQPFGTADQIARCHSNGTDVTYREFNALEQAWCRDQALAPGRMVVFDSNYDSDGLWRFRVGRAVFDKMTHTLLACLLVEVSTQRFFAANDNLVDDAVFRSNVGVIRWKDGKVLNATTWIPNPTEQSIVPIEDLIDDFGMDQEMLRGLRITVRENYLSDEKVLDSMTERNGFYVGAYPFPPPSKGDADYTPEFIALFSVYTSELQEELSNVQSMVATSVRNQSLVIVGVAAVSLCIILGCVYIMSLYISSPLAWMNVIGNQVLSSAGGTGDNGADTTRSVHDDWSTNLDYKPWSYRYSPRTEITELVDEFHRMLLEFSGRGTAGLSKHDFLEVKNPFVLFDNFQKLYNKRKEVSFQSNYSTHKQAQTSEDHLGLETSGVVLPEERLHWGPNAHRISEDETQRNRLHDSLTMGQEIMNRRRGGSRLFWWICVCVAMPLVVCLLSICCYVLVQSWRNLPSLVGTLEEAYLSLERSFLLLIVRLRALYASEALSIPARDLHVFTRMAGWSLFGGFPLAPTFTEMWSGGEKCKDYDFGTTCPAIQNTPITACDCNWKDPVIQECQSGLNESRLLQAMFFEGLREDADPSTGSRNSTTFPKVGLYPNQTYFWPTIDSLTGADKGYNSSGYETTFDRVRSVSALSMISIPLYNYVEGTELDRTWGTFMTFEADGLFSGYVGCSFEHAYLAHWRHTNDTRRFGRQELCPVDKYGIDGRCLRHFIDGKAVALSGKDVPPFFITVPRAVTASNSEVQSRAVLPLIDVTNGELVAQTMVRLSLQDVWDKVNETELGVGSFRLVTGAGHQVDWRFDTIHLWDNPFRPGSELPKKASDVPLSSVVVPRDNCQGDDPSATCDKFAEIVSNIHNGSYGYDVLTRTSFTGKSEIVNYNFAPITLKSFRQVDPSNFSAGLHEFISPIFSLSFGQTEEGVNDSFDRVSEDIVGTLQQSLIILVLVVIIALVLVIVVSWFLALSISEPVSQLCLLVTSINRSQFNADFPEMKSESVELVNVRRTFERLHMLVRAGNSIFFTGDLERALRTFYDALVLFTKLKNKKAIGVTNNNLGNVMLTLYRTLRKTGFQKLCGLGEDRVVEKGLSHYERAIDAGEDALKRIYDTEGWSENYLIFMQQLSNRYFNRAMFLLTVRESHPDPVSAVHLGMMDLSTCKDMDREVVDNGDREGFKGGKDVYFDLLLSRIKGILVLMEMGYEDEWGLEDLFDAAKVALILAVKSGDDHALFRDLEPAGQMQRLDGALIEYYLLVASRDVGDDRTVREDCLTKAAIVASRMMFEDDYVFGEVGILALKALIEFTQLCTNDDLGGDDPSDVRSTLFQYRQAFGETIALAYTSKDVVCRESYHAANSNDFFMETF